MSPFLVTLVSPDLTSLSLTTSRFNHIFIWTSMPLTDRLYPLQWRHDGRYSVSNHRPHDCLLNRLFRRRSKKTSKLRVTGLCAGNSPGTGEFPAQMASNAENVFVWWRHHVVNMQQFRCYIPSVQSGDITRLLYTALLVVSIQWRAMSHHTRITHIVWIKIYVGQKVISVTTVGTGYRREFYKICIICGVL